MGSVTALIGSGPAQELLVVTVRNDGDSPIRLVDGATVEPIGETDGLEWFLDFVTDPELEEFVAYEASRLPVTVDPSETLRFVFSMPLAENMEWQPRACKRGELEVVVTLRDITERTHTAAFWVPC
jgi:hypothetical protein